MEKIISSFKDFKIRMYETYIGRVNFKFLHNDPYISLVIVEKSKATIIVPDKQFENTYSIYHTKLDSNNFFKKKHTIEQGKDEGYVINLIEKHIK